MTTIDKTPGHQYRHKSSPLILEIYEDGGECWIKAIRAGGGWLRGECEMDPGGRWDSDYWEFIGKSEHFRNLYEKLNN